MNILKNFIPLVKREIWDNFNFFIRAPLIIAAALVIISALGTINGVTYVNKSVGGGLIGKEQFKFNIDDEEFKFNINKEEMSESNRESFDKVSHRFWQGTIGFTLVIFLLSTSYLSSSLYQDRKDRSILFWRSLPFGESEAVLAKLVSGAIIFPLIVMTLLALSSLLSTLILYIGASVLGFGSIVTKVSSQLIVFNPSIIFTYIMLLVVLAVSLLPFFLWFLLFSAGSKRNPFLLAIAIPTAFDIATFIIFREPYFWVYAKKLLMLMIDNANSLALQLQPASVNWTAYLIALCISAALFSATVWLRNNRYEI